MNSFLLSVVLMAQVQGSGVVSGVLRDISGNPVPNVRVALAEVSNMPNGAEPGSVLVSLATTADSGAYRLENVPTGRYFIVAGSVDRPTYYPGTPDPATAKLISISAGLVVAGMDFVVTAESLRSRKPVPGLPLVGHNVLQLIQLLGTQPVPGPQRLSNQPFTFAFESVNGRLVSFKASDGSPLRHDCFGSTIANPPRDCYFVVSDAGVFDGNLASQYGVAFRMKDGSPELEFTCLAAQCKVEINGATTSRRTLKGRENGVLAISSAATFTITP